MHSRTACSLLFVYFFFFLLFNPYIKFLRSQLVCACVHVCMCACVAMMGLGVQGVGLVIIASGLFIVDWKSGFLVSLKYFF